MKAFLCRFLLFLCTVSAATAYDRYLLIGSPGNPAHPGPDNAAGHGSVPYSFRLGKWEVTNGEWAVFLNTVATGTVASADVHGLYDPRMGSDPRGGILQITINGRVLSYLLRTNMGDKPVSYVTLYDAMRYCNWLHHGQSSDKADTERGAYFMSAAAEQASLHIPRATGARYWLPNVDEWFKAAYFNGANGQYGTYPFGDTSTAAPVAATATATGDCANPGPRVCNFGRNADWNSQDGHVLTIGSCGSKSFFGCYDMAGNSSEWSDSRPTEAGAQSSGRLLGGDYILFPAIFTASSIESSYAERTIGNFGLRVACTDPAPPLTVSRFTLATPPGPDPQGYDVSITVPSQLGCRYTVEAAPRLFLWEAVPGADPRDGTGGPITLTFRRNRTLDFFRVRQSFQGEE